MTRSSVGDQRLPVGDLYGPFFKVRFFSDIGQVLEAITRNEVGDDTGTKILNKTFSDNKDPVQRFLSQGGKHTQGSVQAQILLDHHRLDTYAESLRVEFLGEAKKANITITFTPDRTRGLQIVDFGVLKARTLTLVEWGYAGALSGQDILSGPHLFYMNGLPDIKIGNDVSITITGQDIVSSPSLRNERGQDDARFPRSRFPRDFDILKELARRLGVNVVFDGCFISTGDGKNSLMDKKTFPDVIISRSNDFAFLKQVVRENNAGFMMKGRDLVLHDLDKCLSSFAPYTFAHWSQITDAYTIPMQSFEMDVSKSYWGISAANGIECLQDDPDGGATSATVMRPERDKEIGFQGRHVAVGGTTAGKGQDSPEGRVTYGEELPADRAAKFISLPEGKANPVGVARNILRRAIKKTAAEANVVLVGHPSVVPFTNANIVGVGELYSGQYTLKSAIHELGSNGYDVQAVVFRHGVGKESSTTLVPKGKKSEEKETSAPPVLFKELEIL